MKSVKEIERRLEDIQKSNCNSISADNEIGYLRLAAMHNDDEQYIRYLLTKYTCELEERKAIVKALSWVLEDD